MSVIAYDSRVIAADKRALSNGTIFTCTKLIYDEPNHSFYAGNGCLDSFMTMVYWYEHGHKIEEWPSSQSTDDWCELIVIERGEMKIYQRQPHHFTHSDTIQAFGSGKDIAIGAMEMGADAIRAAEIACLRDSGCGCGIDAYVIATGEKLR